MVVDWPDLGDHAGKSRADTEENETGKDDQCDHQRFQRYGLGSLSDDLPGYIVMISKGRGGSQALYSRLWGILHLVFWGNDQILHKQMSRCGKRWWVFDSLAAQGHT